MAKKGVTVRKNGIQHPDGRQGHEVSISEHDNPLPEAEELEKLLRLDPSILEYLKTHSAKEQEFRHKSFHEKIKIAHKETNSGIGISYLGMVFGFGTMILGILYSYELLKAGHDVKSSIFAGTTLLIGVSMFLAKAKDNNKNKPRPSNI